MALNSFHNTQRMTAPIDPGSAGLSAADAQSRTMRRFAPNWRLSFAKHG
ncbi:MAG: hypothetical protein AB7E24_09890 [Novosphingobium sp.]